MTGNNDISAGRYGNRKVIVSGLPDFLKRKKGGLCLEAALILPMVLLLVGTLVGVILTVETEIKLKGALDRTAAELSLASPLCELLAQNDMFRNVSQVMDGEAGREINTAFQEIFPGLQVTSILADASLDLASTNILGPLISKRLDYWLAETESGQPGWLGFLDKHSLYLDWNLTNNQLWLCLNFQLKSPAGCFQKQVKSVVPIWIGFGGDEEGQDSDKIWLLDNFSRGQEIRRIFSCNLPYDFPVIASFTDGEAISVKSMDLTAPTYLELEPVRNRIRQQIKILADFQGSAYVRPEQNIEITAESITRRKLILVIPDNCTQPWLDAVISDMKQQAAGLSVDMELVLHGSSSRYQNEPVKLADQD